MARSHSIEHAFARNLHTFLTIHPSLSYYIMSFKRGFTMVRDNQRYISIISIFFDIVIMIISYLLSMYVAFGSRMENLLPFRVYMYILAGIIPVYLFIYRGFRLYNSRKYTRLFRNIRNTIAANVTGILILTLFLYLFRKRSTLMHFSIKVVVCFFIFNCILQIVERLIIRMVLNSMRKQEAHKRHLLMVGLSPASNRLVDAIGRNPGWGYAIDGVLDDIAEVGTGYKQAKVIGKLSDLPGILNEQNTDEVVITLPLAAYGKLGEIVGICEKYGIHTKFVPDYSEVISSRPVTEDMDGVAAINIRNVPLTDPVNRLVKRLMDIFFSLFFIILFSPVMIIAALAVKLTSPGPIIFKQKRVGFHNKEFNMYKFRSMVVQDPKEEKKGWTTKSDPRVTPVGKFIRKTSVDELPQFFNVLFGTMSIVGPRPERKQFVDEFMEEIPRYNVKHQVRPGITGWAQVNGLRGDTSIPERIKYDLFYIENWSVWFDIRIMFLTVFKGFVNKNAY